MSGRVLVIEDEPIIRMVLEEILAECGWEVTVAKDGREGRAAFAQAPDLVLLDLRLPDVDGLELLAELLAARPACRVVVMSGHGTPETVRRALDAGATHFLHKPFPLEQVEALLQRLANSVEA